MKKEVRHPAKFTDSFIPLFAVLLKGRNKVIDPMAGTGKIGMIKEHGFEGVVYANDLEFEWLKQATTNNCDILSLFDASNMKFESNYFDAICTSPTYGNRMADSHNAKDESKRNTYTHALGRKLHNENTGRMQWGKKYKDKHVEIYREFNRVLKTGALFILNIKDHIRKGEVVEVSDFHKELILSLGFELTASEVIPVKGNGFGQNGNLRVWHENVFVFTKVGDIFD